MICAWPRLRDGGWLGDFRCDADDGGGARRGCGRRAWRRQSVSRHARALRKRRRPPTRIAVCWRRRWKTLQTIRHLSACQAKLRRPITKRCRREPSPRKAVSVRRPHTAAQPVSAPVTPASIPRTPRILKTKRNKRRRARRAAQRQPRRHSRQCQILRRAHRRNRRPCENRRRRRFIRRKPRNGPAPLCRHCPTPIR